MGMKRAEWLVCWHSNRYIYTWLRWWNVGNIPLYCVQNVEFRNNSRNFPRSCFFFPFALAISSTALLLCYLNVRAKWQWLNNPHPIDMQPNRSSDVASPLRATLIPINFMDNRRTHPKHLMQLNSKINCNISIAEPHNKPTEQHRASGAGRMGEKAKEGGRTVTPPNREQNSKWQMEHFCGNYFWSKFEMKIKRQSAVTWIHKSSSISHDDDARGDNEPIELRCYPLNIFSFFFDHRYVVHLKRWWLCCVRPVSNVTNRRIEQPNGNQQINKREHDQNMWIEKAIKLFRASNFIIVRFPHTSVLPTDSLSLCGAVNVAVYFAIKRRIIDLWLHSRRNALVFHSVAVITFSLIFHHLCILLQYYLYVFRFVSYLCRAKKESDVKIKNIEWCFQVDGIASFSILELHAIENMLQNQIRCVRQREKDGEIEIGSNGSQNWIVDIE